ncbi:MAG: AAA family ATPase [Defluviitaleaceae bacterium]|nr:AAA family ATPase [Defluviitaleaceae bacterium]
MAKIITFFNHKGGVGKTTLAYNVAWGLASAGKKTLMIDADPQCNLTEITLPTDTLYNDEDENLDLLINDNIYKYLLPFVEPVYGQEISKVRTFQKKENLDLLLGSIKLAEMDKTISLSISNVPGLGGIPKAVQTALKNISDDKDFVIIDLSPALSATNQLLLLLSDYFILPVTPSIFSQQALSNLLDIFQSWNREVSHFEIFNRKIKPLPKMLGIVCQNYRPYSRKDEINTTSAKKFEDRMEKLNQKTLELAGTLSSFHMALTIDDFKNIFQDSEPYRIANIPDYNQLGQISETEKVPVSAIDTKILGKHNINKPEYKQKVEDFQIQCSNIVNGLLRL